MNPSDELPPTCVLALHHELDRAIAARLDALLRTPAPDVGHVEPPKSDDTVGRPALILLPGMLSTAAAWAGVVERLLEDADLRVPRIDLDDSIAGMASSVLADAPDRFALAGHSLGGIVALEVLRQASDRVTRLALLNTSARDPSPEQVQAWSTLQTRLAAEDFAALADELARANLPERVVNSNKDQLVAHGTQMARAVGPDGLRRQLNAQASRPDSRPQLARVSVPTLVVSGGRDQVCPVFLQDEIAEALPLARHLVLPHVGHMAPMEDPEAVSAALRTWLTEHSA